MCEEKKFLFKRQNGSGTERLTESEAFIYPVGIKSAQSMYWSHFFS